MECQLNPDVEALEEGNLFWHKEGLCMWQIQDGEHEEPREAAPHRGGLGGGGGRGILLSPADEG